MNTEESLRAEGKIQTQSLRWTHFKDTNCKILDIYQQIPLQNFPGWLITLKQLFFGQSFLIFYVYMCKLNFLSNMN